MSSVSLYLATTYGEQQKRLSSLKGCGAGHSADNREGTETFLPRLHVRQGAAADHAIAISIAWDMTTRLALRASAFRL
jgi:hypothetical protein